MDWNDLIPIEQLDVMIIHLMLVAQTVFLVMWSRLPWWENWIGRALWVKSVSLWLLIIVSVTLFWALLATDAEWIYAKHLTVAIHFFVVFGIISQIGALAYEMRRDRDHVSIQTKDESQGDRLDDRTAQEERRDDQRP